MADHRPLHRIDEPGRVRTGGRLELDESDDGWELANAHSSLPVRWRHPPESLESGTLVRVEGRWDGDELTVDSHRICRRSRGESTLPRRTAVPDLAEVVEARDALNRDLRSTLRERDFLEVETPNAVPAPGTDLYLEPVGTRSPEERDSRTVPPYLHTSPEFAMKRLLSEGFERIYQLVKVWRDGEVSELHHPEFTLLELYRAWEGLDAVIEDAERIVAGACDGEATLAERTEQGVEHRRIDLDPPFERVPMPELVREVAGFELVECLEYEDLRREVVRRDLLTGDLDRRHPPEEGRWDELFFELMVARIEPFLAELGAVVVTDWPAPLAILARKSDEDPRLARRFELYVGGIELANGFDELTDPVEQRRRFERERSDRASMDRPALPMPERFLEALRYGLPPSAGVALGVDRLLMLAVGAARLDDVAPFARAP